MKFAILVLLGLCALVSAGGSVARPGNQIDTPDVTYAVENSIFNGVQNKVEELIKKASADADVVVQKVKELASKVQQKLVDLGKSLKEKYEGIKAGIVAKVEELKQKGEHFKECAEPIVPEFEEIEKQAGSDFEACAKEVSEEYKKFEVTVHNDVESIKTSVKEFNEEIAKCISFNIFEFVKCAKAKVEIFQKLFKSFKDSSLDAVKLGHDFASEILSEVDTCNKAAAKKAIGGISFLQQKLSECSKQ